MQRLWNALVEVTYEGIKQVKTFEINIPTHQCELFKIKNDESIKYLYTRFTNIIMV